MDVNRWFGAGRATRKPELRQTDGGTDVCEVGLAVNRRYETAGGDKRTDTLFIDVVFWGNRAKVIAKYVKKGTPLFIEGRLELDQWQSPDGEKRSRVRVVCEQFQFIDRPQKEDATAASGE